MKSILAFTILGILATAGLIYIVLQRFPSIQIVGESPAVTLNLSSPNQEYKLQLNENVDRHIYIFPINIFEFRKFNEVRFSAFKDEQALIENEGLWEDTSSDMRYFDVYKPQWISDSVLKFSDSRTFAENKMDEVVVLNNTNQPIGYLLVNAGERFLILDLQPNEKVKLSTTPQSWASWISCGGNFQVSKKKFYSGVNFSIHDGNENHVSQHYFVTVKDDEVLIQSQEFEGYKSTKEVDIKVPKYDKAF
jgi:hypothetical protein